jgi:putative ABC transport system permease protein
MVPEVEVASPLLSYWNRTAYHDEESYVSVVKGIRPDYALIESPKMRYGRFINDNDLLSSRKVCVLGKEVYKSLFPEGGDPCGEAIRIDGIYYRIVGVNWSAGNMSINGSADEAIIIPINIFRQVYNTGNEIQLLCFTAREGITMSDIIPRVREVIARRHYVDPTDEMGLIMINAQLIFGLQDSLFKGLAFVIWLIGLGTLLAGGIGVSNIMMVSVKERTSEIGIRRAIGATPRMILSQIIAESITLTLAAGMMGIVIAALILAAVNMGMTEDGILKADYQVSFITAVSAALLLTVLGVAAGLAPAARAMGIKPVDAMHEE